MSKRVLIVASVLSLAVLAGCTGPRPQFHECGGGNCRGQGREVDEVVSRLPSPATATATAEAVLG